jgi:hypothetical protein
MDDAPILMKKISMRDHEDRNGVWNIVIRFLDIRTPDRD